MPKLNQRGAIQFVILFILLAGIVGVVYLVTSGPLKIFPKAGGGISGPITATTAITLSPNANTINVGDELAAKLLVRSDISAANLFTAKIIFNNKLLAVDRIEYSSSLITNWVEQYSDNDSGIISLVGGVPNPGFQTSVGSPPAPMAVIYFKAIQNGDGWVNVTDDSAIYSNEDNINLLTIRDGFIITINPSGTIPTPKPTPNSMRVFVTSTTYNGNLGGLSGADAKCQERANTANLGGSWKAWITDMSQPYTDVAARFQKSNQPYKLLDGRLVANNWSDLTDQTLANPINYTETNQLLTSSSSYTNVWSNTSTGGNIWDTQKTCNNWSSNSTLSQSSVGSVLRSDYEWSALLNTYPNCSTEARLFCFEQTSSTVPVPSATPAPQPGNGDGNGDGKVNFVDLSVLLSDYNKNKGFRTGIDINNDGIINAFDFSLMRNLLIKNGLIRG